MSTRTIDTKLSITGEKEYRQKLSEVNQSLKVLGSEMKLATAKFRDNEDSVEALSAKQEILSKRVDTQKAKVATLREALSKSAEAYGENDRKTKDWQKSLNDAEAELEDLNRELDKHDDALLKANAGANQSQSAFSRLKSRFSDVFGEAKPLGDVVGDLAGKFGVDLPEGLSSSLNGLGEVSPAMLTAAGAAASLVTAVIKVEQGLMNMTREAATAADELLTLSEQTNVAADDLQAFAYASEFIDVSVDALQDGLKETTMRIAEVSEGSEDVVNRFAELGVSTRTADGELRSASDVFYDLVDALGEIGNTTERDALAMELFGESASQLNPLINRGSDALREYAQEASDLGYVLDDRALEALQDVDDAQQKLLKTQEAVTKQISAEYAPQMEDALGDTADFVKDIGDALSETGVVDSFGELLSTSAGLLEPLGELIKSVLPGLDSGLGFVAKKLAFIVDYLTVIVGTLPQNWGSGLFTKGLGLGISRGDLNAQQKLEYGDSGWTYNSSTGMWEGNVFSGNAAGTSNWRGGLTWVGENGPELVNLPRGTQVLTAQESRGTGGDVYNITIDAKSVQEFTDIVRIAQSQRRMLRMEGVPYGNG